MLNKIVSYINWYLGELNNYDFQFEDDKGDCVIKDVKFWIVV